MASKCQGRLNQVCAPTGDDGSGSCLPLCFDDAECDSGLVCNLRTGLCTEQQSPGAAHGTPCTGNSQCAGGTCLAASENEGLCSGPCAFQNLPNAGCGHTRGSDEALPALCLPSTELYPNELGSCIPLCDSDTDCHLDDLKCQAFETDTVASLGRQGICSKREDSQ